MPPVVVVERPNRLRIRVKVGERENGAPILRSLSYVVKTNASHQNIYDVGIALGSLCQYPVEEIVLTEDKLLTE